MLYTRIVRFDMMATVVLFGKSFRELNKAIVTLILIEKI